MLTLFWTEVALAAASTVLAVLTAVYPTWIESLTGLDPDAGSGAAEWLVVVLLALAAVVLAAGARLTWSALRPARG
jgi:hypothetical protein